MSNSKFNDPLQNLFTDIAKIIDFIEIKDESKAKKFETRSIKSKAIMWMNAKLKRDGYITYKSFWNFSMFQEVELNIKINMFKYYMDNPSSVPIKFRNNLLEKGRQLFLDSYEEENDYYRTLNGLPPYGTKQSDFIYLSEPIRNQLHAPDEPLHLLSSVIQNNYMNTDDYKRLIKENPDKEYLKYLGIYKIDIFTARSAKDFEIIRYTLNRSDINPNLIDKFSSVYADYREYVVVTLYNSQLEDIYKGYRNFMGMIIMMMTLLQLTNVSVESVTNKKFLDDSMLHIVLSMYGVPDDLLLTNEVRRKLVNNILLLTKEKATDDVYYRLVDILGYTDVVISKLLLMKGMKFDSDNDFKAINENEPYFLQIDLKDKNPYETIATGNAPIHEYHSIIDEDPRWWDTKETQSVLKNNTYSESYSKYITIEAVIHQMKYMFESIYFTKLIIDNKYATDTFYISIPELFGTDTVSIYDLMVFIISAMCETNGLSGDIISDETKLIATAGFNFNIEIDSFNKYIESTKYVDKDRIYRYLNNLKINDSTDLNRLFNEVLYPMREWLELKIKKTNNRHEYIEYESIYRALYTYDINNNPFLDDYKIPLDIICERYNISKEELRAYQHFYPRTIDGDRITEDEYDSSRYHRPFIALGNEISYYIPIIIDTIYGEEDRGNLYLHDIINCKDCREIINPDGTRIFMDYEDEDLGWVINKKAVSKALEIINDFDPKMLYKAVFQINTPILNSGGLSYSSGEKLPENIRSGLFKNILLDKLSMDLDGYANPPKTYKEYLYRKNSKLYNLLNDSSNNKDVWLENVLKIILAIETHLDLHLKYFEQSVVGSDLFFKPLITLINHFKSTLVEISKTGLKFVFDDRMDSGGNSNMLKLFDEVEFIVHFVTLANKGYNSQLKLYDTEHKATFHINLNDKTEIFQTKIGEGFTAEIREMSMGSISMYDEVKLFKNGKPIDPNDFSSVWISGEPGNGRWSEDDDILMRSRKESTRVILAPIDFDAWKETR